MAAGAARCAAGVPLHPRTAATTTRQRPRDDRSGDNAGADSALRACGKDDTLSKRRRTAIETAPISRLKEA